MIPTDSEDGSQALVHRGKMHKREAEAQGDLAVPNTPEAFCPIA